MHGMLFLRLLVCLYLICAGGLLAVAQQVPAEPVIALVPRSGAFQPGAGATNAIAFDNHTGKLAIGFTDGSVRWWTSAGQSTDAPWPKASDAVTALAISPQGGKLALATGNNVELYEIAPRKLLKRIPGTQPVKSLVFSHSEELLVIADDLACRIIKTGDASVLHTVTVTSPFKSAVFLNQDQMLVIADKVNQHNSVSLKDFISTRNGYYQKLPGEKKGKFLPVLAVASSGDQRVLTSVLLPGSFAIQSNSRAHIDERMVLPIKNWIRFDIRVSQDGRYALSMMSSTPRAVPKGYIWDLVDKKQTATLENVPQQIASIAFSPAQALVAMRSSEGEVSLWSLKAAFTSPEPPRYVCGTAVELSNPSDPAAPVFHKDYVVRRTEIPNAPAWLKNDVWEVLPYGRGAFLNLLKTKRDTTCLYVLPNPKTPQDYDQYLRVITFSEDKENWHNGGACPWQPDSTLLCQPIGSDQSVPAGSLPLSQPGSRLLFVGNHDLLRPEHLKQLPMTTQRQLFVDQIRRLFRAKEFAQIEKLAAAARSKGEMFGWGFPKLEAIYDGMSSVRYRLPVETCHQLATAYVQAEPASPTARIVLAKSLVSLGWSYRGRDFASNVSPENAEKFASHLATAGRMLSQNSTKYPKDPALEQEMIAALAGGNLSAKAVSDLILKGLKKDPANLDTITSGTAFLLPRWTGQPQAALELTERIREQHPGKVGQALCAKVALDIFSLEPERWQDLFRFDAAQFQKDWDAFYALQPHDHYRTTLACQIMAIYGDVQTARAQWQTLGIHASPRAAGDVSELQEWSAYFKGDTHPALLWSRLGKGDGQVMLTPDGEHLLACSRIGRLSFYKTASGELLGQDIAGFFSLRDGVLPKAGLALLATEVGILRYDNDTGISRVPYPDGLQPGRSRFSPDGSRLIVVDSEASLRLLNPGTGATLAVIPPQIKLERPVSGAWEIGAEFAISPDQQVIAAQVSQSPVRLIQLSDGKVLSTLPHETATGVASLCFDETGQQLWMTRGEHATIQDIATLKQVGEFPAVRRIAANLIASPDGRYVAVVQNSGPGFLAAVTVLDRKAQTPEWRALPGMAASARLAWHSRQPWLATYSDSGILRVWDIDKFLTK